MNRILLLFLSLGTLATSGLGAQEAKIVEYAHLLARAFTNDGLVLQTGIGADGVQNLAVLANGGYFPLSMRAKAGVASVLRIYTDKTYDCSRSFFLPDLNKQAALPVKGATAFSLPPMKKGSTLFGTCGMGMYTFEIYFE